MNKITLFFITLLCLALKLQAQSTFELGPTNEAIDNFFQTEGIQISNSVLISGNRDEQLALISDGVDGANLSIDQGIAFSTGNIEFDLSNNNSQAVTSNTHSPYLDDDLRNIDSLAVFDVVIYQFDVEIQSPTVNQIKFRYQFGSEEYPNWVGSQFNDVFAIFVSGPGFEDATNVATIPTSGNPTAVNFVNGGVLGSNSDGSPADLSQTNLYINNGHVNDGSSNTNPQPGPFPVHAEYNGITEIIESQISGLQFGETYTIKIAIADVADAAYDSGVIFDPLITDFGEADLSFSKDGEIFEMQNEEYLTPGDLLRYEFILTNLGEQLLTSIEIDDFSFPEELQIPPLENTSLLSGESLTIEAFYAITQEDINTGVVYNQAEATAITESSQSLNVLSVDPTPIPQNNPFYLQSCPECTAVILPQNPAISLIKSARVNPDIPYAPELNEVLVYDFEVKNTGNVDLYDLELNDELDFIEIYGEIDFLQVGQIDTASFFANYPIQQIDLDRGEVINQAQIFAFSPLDIQVSDASDFDNFFDDRPTRVEFSECNLEVFNAITPNNDGINDVFKIQGIECFPENRLQIFNRYGVKIYDEKNYDNQQVVFDGKSTGRATIGKDSKLPSGVYFYILEYSDREGAKQKKQGDLYINTGN